MHLRDSLIPKYTELVYDGFWFSPEHEARHRNATRCNRSRAPQTVQRQHHRCRPQKPESLYDPKIATMESDDSLYDQSDATGFIRLNALRLRLRAIQNGLSESPQHF